MTEREPLSDRWRRNDVQIRLLRDLACFGDPDPDYEPPMPERRPYVLGEPISPYTVFPWSGDDGLDRVSALERLWDSDETNAFYGKCI